MNVASPGDRHRHEHDGGKEQVEDLRENEKALNGNFELSSSSSIRFSNRKSNGKSL